MLSARAASACGDAEDSLNMIKRANGMAAGLSSSSMFWYHMTGGEAHMLIAESSHATAAAASAAAAAASFSQALATSPSLSTTAQMKLHVAIGTRMISMPAIYHVLMAFRLLSHIFGDSYCHLCHSS